MLKNPLIQQAFEKISSLPDFKEARLSYDHGIRIDFKADKEQMQAITHLAQSLKPWRKGPFYLNDLCIDSEWRSFIKWQQLEGKIHLQGKDVMDMGCNNGYYLFEMLKHEPKSLVGFDPGEIFYAQFHFIQHFLRAPIVYELLGLQDLWTYERKFDVIFCLGVLYHRSDPISALKALSSALRKDGELILDTLIIDDEREICLFPKESYAKMRNVYFLPSILALEAWCHRARLEVVEILSLSDTTTQEQRKTSWIDSLSLESFLKGYPPPRRGYFRIKRGSNG